jgi:hypothetical protein
MTTISDPAILGGYRANLDRHGSLDVDVIVIPDRRTPVAAFETRDRSARQGLRVTGPTLDEQNCFLQ